MGSISLAYMTYPMCEKLKQFVTVAYPEIKRGKGCLNIWGVIILMRHAFVDSMNKSFAGPIIAWGMPSATPATFRTMNIKWGDVVNEKTIINFEGKGLLEYPDHPSASTIE